MQNSTFIERSQPHDSFWIPLTSKQMLPVMVGKEVLQHATINQTHFYVTFCSQAGSRIRTFLASANWVVGILVETGNSVDYPLPIRLLSLQWLSLLHHEISWLNKIREHALLKSCPPLLAYLTQLQPFKKPFTFLPTLKKSVSPQVINVVQWQYMLTSCVVLITSFPVTTVLPPFCFLMQKHVLWGLYLVNGSYGLIAFRVNLEWQIQVNQILFLAP